MSYYLEGAFEPASKKQIKTLNRLANALGFQPIERATKCEAETTIQIWTARLEEKEIRQ